MPIIGRVNKYDNVLTGFGHQHVGLTGGAKTGRILADLIDQKKPNIDLRSLRADMDHPLDFFWAKDHLNNYLFVYEYPEKRIEAAIRSSRNLDQEIQKAIENSRVI